MRRRRSSKAPEEPFASKEFYEVKHALERFVTSEGKDVESAKEAITKWRETDPERSWTFLLELQNNYEPSTYGEDPTKTEYLKPETLIEKDKAAYESVVAMQNIVKEDPDLSLRVVLLCVRKNTHSKQQEREGVYYDREKNNERCLRPVRVHDAVLFEPDPNEPGYPQAQIAAKWSEPKRVYADNYKDEWEVYEYTRNFVGFWLEGWSIEEEAARKNFNALLAHVNALEDNNRNKLPGLKLLLAKDVPFVADADLVTILQMVLKANQEELASGLLHLVKSFSASTKSIDSGVIVHRFTTPEQSEIIKGFVELLKRFPSIEAALGKVMTTDVHLNSIWASMDFAELLLSEVPTSKVLIEIAQVFIEGFVDVDDDLSEIPCKGFAFLFRLNDRSLIERAAAKVKRNLGPILKQVETMMGPAIKNDPIFLEMARRRLAELEPIAAAGEPVFTWVFKVPPYAKFQSKKITTFLESPKQDTVFRGFKNMNMARKFIQYPPEWLQDLQIEEGGSAATSYIKVTKLKSRHEREVATFRAQMEEMNHIAEILGVTPPHIGRPTAVAPPTEPSTQGQSEAQPPTLIEAPAQLTPQTQPPSQEQPSAQAEAPLTSHEPTVSAPLTEVPTVNMTDAPLAETERGEKRSRDEEGNAAEEDGHVDKKPRLDTTV